METVGHSSLHLNITSIGHAGKAEEKIHAFLLSSLEGKELHNLYSSPSIIRVIKSRRMRWAGHVARMGGGGVHIGYWWESQKERDHWEDQDVDGWTILKWILKR
jgi:hypothetical protein